MTVDPSPADAGTRRLADLTTFRVGGEARDVVEATTGGQLIDAVRGADADGVEVLLVGGGSNLLVGPEPLTERVVLVRNTGRDVDVRGDDVVVTVGAGVVWDDLVATAVGNGWSGLEALSGIPGMVGATPIQNVGAYGQEVAQTITSVHAYQRSSGQEVRLAPHECAFAYRDSVFKRTPGEYVVLAVEFTLRNAAEGPIAYQQLASALGTELGDSASVRAVRDAVLELRRGKGMVVDPSDHDTWSAGSFFTNPIVEKDAVPSGAPSWPIVDDPSMAKTSAAWLIDHAGFSKGYGLPGPAALSTKHTLALTNRGTATAADVVALAGTVRDGVYDRFGITLEPEPNLIHCALP